MCNIPPHNEGILKRIGIKQKRYVLQLDPPLSTASAVNNYSTHKQLPFRLIAPLLDSYPADFLLHLLEEYQKEKSLRIDKKKGSDISCIRTLVFLFLIRIRPITKIVK
jgi:hypothetical protein